MLSYSKSPYKFNYRQNQRKNTLDFSSPQFLLNQATICLVNRNSKYFTKHYYLNRTLWAKFFLLQRLDLPQRLAHVVDGAQFSSSSNTWVLQYNLNVMLTDDRTTVNTSVNSNKFYLSSVSSVFKSCVWLERELSDFTNINFIGLSDTRRLLLDYFENKQVWQTHVANDKNFNNSLYDVCLSF